MSPDDPTLPNDPSDDLLLDEATRALRASAPSPAALASARQNAWDSLARAAAGVPEACASARPRLAALAAGTLAADEATLVADHCRECLDCRRELGALRHPSVAPVAPPATRAPSRAPRRLALAAAAVLAVALTGGTIWKLSGGSSPDSARLARLDGTLLADGSAPLALGATVSPGETVRTARASRATLELGDGTTVEMNERSAVVLAGTRSEPVVRLLRGDVLVTAAHRASGRLVVETDDCRAAVKGTVFAVGHGLKGSRVGVLQGEVDVTSGEGDRVLRAGDQLATRAALVPVALRQQVAWSGQQERVARLLSELDAAAREVAAEPVVRPAHRSTAILDALPESTVFVACLPNDGDMARLASRLQERISDDPDLAAWWREEVENGQGPESLASVVASLGELSSALGDQVVVALAMPMGAQAPPVPVLVAPVRDEAALRDLVADVAGGIARRTGRPVPGLLDASGLRARANGKTAGHGDAMLALAAGHVLAGPSAAEMQAIADLLDTRSSSAFAGTPFHRELSARLDAGTGFLVAADLARLVQRARAHAAQAPHPEGALTAMNVLGLDSLDRFVMSEGRDDAGTAVLSFQDHRTGVASWLAEPGPMGSLQFVTADATFAMAALSRDPLAVLSDMRKVLGEQRFGDALASAQAELGLDVMNDLAGPLGGEVAFAIDGPLLPTPAWKLVLEVNDEARLQDTLARLVARAGERHEARLVLRDEQSAQGPVRVLASDDGRIVLAAWAVRDGYLVAAPSKALLETALQAGRIGRSLASRADFQSQLPADAEEHFSILAWENAGPALAQLPAGALDAARQMPGLAALAGGDGKPLLVHGRAEDRAITLQLGGEPGATGGRAAELLRGLMLRALASRAVEAGGGMGYDAGPQRQAEPVRRVSPGKSL